MVMLIKYENPTLVNPMPRVYNLDNPRDREELERLLDITLLHVEHLHTGEALVIECLDREDDDDNTE